MTLGLGSADVDIKRVNDGLSEIFGQSCTSQGGKIHAMEIFLIPEIHLNYNISSHFQIFHFHIYFVELLHVKGFISEGSKMKISSGWKHFTTRFQKLFSMKKSFKHSTKQKLTCG